MKITAKLFATFREGRQKIETFELPEGTNVEDIITTLGIEKSEIAILLVNGRDSKFEKVLEDGDVLALFPPVGGG
jgi:sulfur-carrier protein